MLGQFPTDIANLNEVKGADGMLGPAEALLPESDLITSSQMILSQRPKQDGHFHDSFTRLKDSMFQDKKSVRPIFLLSFGPMGSGKSTRCSEWITTRGGDPKNYVFLVLDDIVESDNRYQSEVQALRDTYGEHNNSSEITNLLQEIYFRFFVLNLLVCYSTSFLKLLSHAIAGTAKMLR